MTFLIIALFLALFSFRGYAEPTWSGNAGNTPSNYDSSTYSTFNVTWSNGTASTNITQVNITINYTGTPTNYTMNRISGDEYNGAYGYQEILGKGTYQWRSCAIDNDTNENCTDYYNFTIEKASTSMTLTLNGSAANKTYNLYQNATFAASLNVANKAIYLNSTHSSWTNLTNATSFATNTINLTTTGLFSVIAYWNGDENYSLSNQTYSFNVTDLNFSGNSSSSASGVSYDASRTYNFSINLTGSVSNVTFEANFIGGNHTYTATNATTYNYITINKSGNTYWIVFPALAFGTYQYRWLANDTNNIWINTASTSYIINPYPITLSLIVSGSSFSQTQPSGSPATIICSATSWPLTLNLYGGCTLVSGGNSVSCTYTPTSGATGSTVFNCDNTNPNYTNPSASNTLSYAPFTQQGSNPGSGTQNQTSSGAFTLTSSSSSVALEPNQSKVITLTLSNPSSNDIININLSVSGINSSWYTLDRTSITRLKNTVGVNTSKLTLNIPMDAERKTYTITITAVGRDPIAVKTITKTASITLTVATEEAATNVTEETNETTNETAAELLSTQVTEIPSPTGLSINPDDFKNIVLFFGLVAMGLVFIFRNNVTEFLMRGRTVYPQVKKEAKQETKPEVKKPHIFSHIKNKYKALGQHKLVIELKKKEKDKEKV